MEYNEEYLSVKNLNLYNVDRAMIAAGFPMSTDVKQVKPSKERIRKLFAVKPNTGHDCAAKGMLVTFDLTAAQYFWQQAKRYNWFDIVSSQSTMHRITKMDLDIVFTPNVAAPTISMLRFLVETYNHYADITSNDDMEVRKQIIFGNYGIQFDNEKELFHAIIENIPSGLKLTAHISTNFLQLKTIMVQREYHKLEDWRIFCKEMLKQMPLFAELMEVFKNKVHL